jgi:hypothetical protein
MGEKGAQAVSADCGRQPLVMGYYSGYARTSFVLRDLGCLKEAEAGSVDALTRYPYDG